MRVLADMDELPPELRFVFTVGVFDGVHRGHTEVLRALLGCAAEASGVPVVMTFEPHPQAVLAGSAPPLLCDPAERLARLEAAGVEIAIVQRFDEAFRQQSAEAFLDRLRRGRELAGVVMSSESAFGHDREGTVDLVRRLAAEEGWRLVEVPTLELRGGRVSSGRIRGLIESGDLRAAAELLGRPYSVPALAEPPDRVAPVAIVLALRAGLCLPPVGDYEVRLGPGGWRGPAGRHAGRESVAERDTALVRARARLDRDVGRAIEMATLTILDAPQRHDLTDADVTFTDRLGA